MIEQQVQVLTNAFQNSCRHLDSLIPKNFNSTASNSGIGVFSSNNQMLNPSIKNSLCARRSSPMDTARFKGDVHSCSGFRLPVEILESIYFCMIFSSSFVITDSNDFTILDNQCSNHGIGMCITPTFASLLNCKTHHLFIKTHGRT